MGGISFVQFMRLKCKSTLLHFITLHPIVIKSQRTHNKSIYSLALLAAYLNLEIYDRCIYPFTNTKCMRIECHANICFTAFVLLLLWWNGTTVERSVVRLWTGLTILHTFLRHSHCSLFQCTVHRQNQINFPIQCVHVKCHTRIGFSNFSCYWSHTVLQ